MWESEEEKEVRGKRSEKEGRARNLGGWERRRKII